MKEIKCVYKNGDEKTFPYDIFGEHIENIIRSVKHKRGMTYAKVLQSPLVKVYIDGELVLDEDDILKGVELENE